MNLIPTYQKRQENKQEAVRTRLLAGLVYFEIFRYPLNAKELSFLCSCREKEVKEVLEKLLSENVIKHESGYYSLGLNGEDLERRLKGNEEARKKMKKALRYGRFIGSFPFVRAVGISGSLSKGYLDKKGDFDFFIITSVGRIWLCRTLLILFKKIFLLNSKKYFCINYFIDCVHLEIEDKNIFTAIEINTLLPAYNHKLLLEFRSKNNWATAEAGTHWHVFNTSPEPKNGLLKRTAEKLLSGPFGDRLDGFCMKVTMMRWRKKFAHFNRETMELALRSRIYVSKHHPNNFQKKVIDALEEKRLFYADKFGS